jgi:hypothetical protein
MASPGRDELMDQDLGGKSQMVDRYAKFATERWPSQRRESSAP